MTVYDLWHSSVKRDENGDPLRLKRYGTGKRWRCVNTGYPSKSFHKKGDAEKLHKEREGRIVANQLPLDRSAATMSVRDAVIKAIETDLEAGEIGKETARKYKSTCNRLAFPFFAELTLREVFAQTIKEWKAWLYQQKNRKGDPYSVSTIDIVWSVVGGMFRRYVGHAIDVHPYQGVDRVERNGPTGVIPWERDRVETLLPHVSERGIGPVTMGISCGTRPSESLAFSLSDFRQRKGKVRVRHQVAADISTGPALRLVKNGDERYVPIAPSTVAEVEEVARKFGTITVRCECHGEDNVLVFHNNGRPWTRKDFDRFEWKPAMLAAGLLVVAVTPPEGESAADANGATPVGDGFALATTGPDLRLVEGDDELSPQADPGVGMHSLRHFYASCEIDEGVPPWELQKRLGHRSLSTTMGIYVHLFAKHDSDAVDRTEARVSGLLTARRAAVATLAAAPAAPATAA